MSKEAFTVNEGDVVTRNELNQIVKIEKEKTVIRVIYRSDGSVWTTDHLKK